MEVILLKKVENLGDLGEKVSVKSGYGRNYLLPTGAAVAATSDNLKAFEARRAELEKNAADAMQLAEGRKAKLEEIGSFTICAKAGEEGKLFGSVGTADIADVCNQAGAEVNKKDVRLPEGPFHTIGAFEVVLHLHSDVDATIQLDIVAEQ